MPNATVNWREASDPTGRPFGPHRFPSGPATSAVYFPKWRRAENTIPKPVRFHLFSKQRRQPQRLTLQLGATGGHRTLTPEGTAF